MSKKRTFKELLQLLPQKEQPEDKAEKEAAEPALQGNEAENAAAAVQHENAYAKLGKDIIRRKNTEINPANRTISSLFAEPTVLRVPRFTLILQSLFIIISSCEFAAVPYNET